jgi:hypothetical protein
VTGFEGFGDLVDGAEIRDPYPHFARLRSESPVAREDAPDGAPPSLLAYSHADDAAARRVTCSCSRTVP